MKLPTVVPPIAVRMDFGSTTMQSSASKRFFLRLMRKGFRPSLDGSEWPVVI